jgi:predicted Fe-Mo cluster-binding NifX family protein
VSQVSAVENPFYARHQPGQVPGFIDSQGADVMIAGGMGRRAIGLFSQYGIEAVTGASGTVRRSLEQYLGGALQGAQPCRESVEHAHEHEGKALHTGLADAVFEEDGVGRLREEVEMLQQQLEEALSRLKTLSGDA